MVKRRPMYGVTYDSAGVCNVHALIRRAWIIGHFSIAISDIVGFKFDLNLNPHVPYGEFEMLDKLRIEALKTWS